MKNKHFSRSMNIAISGFVALALILIIKPFYDNYKEHKKYDFIVQNINGDIKKDYYKGKVLAVYFGYTFCPDVCPTSLSRLSEALKSFSNKQLENFQGLFISVDPERDKLKDLQEYAQYFHPKLQGATSNKENIDDIVNRYESHYEIVPLPDSSMGYSVAHTSYIYIFDKDGNLVEKVDHFSDESAIKRVLEKLL